ncbi:MAG TPA: hypothetical protein DIT10_08905 [Chryseobacterium sp.]|nr:hypothetical protein [Chryseobacterium sp.]
MKKIFFLSVFLMLASCNKGISQETISEVKKNENFWKQREKMITDNEKDNEFPIKKDRLVNEKRVNSIDIHSQSLQFEVYIDDVLLYNFKGEASQHQGGAIGAHEINPLLLTSGTHEVKVRMYPALGQNIFGDAGGLNLIFFHYPYPNLKQVTYNAAMNGEEGIFLDQQKEYWAAEKGEYGKPGYAEAHYEPKEPLKLKGLPMYEWRSTFEADVPFDLVGWRNSVNLKKEYQENKNLNNEVIAEYKKIYEIIKSRDKDKFLQLIKEREDLTAETLYYGANEKNARSNEFVKMLQNNDYELEPLFEETFHLEFQGYGKLVSILNKADKEGIIRLKSKKNPNEKVYLDFLFQRKKKGDKLSVI